MSHLCTAKVSLPLWLCLPTPENPRWGPEKWETGWTPTWVHKTHDHHINDHMTLKTMNSELMLLWQSLTHTLSSTSSAIRRISKRRTIFPECSSTSESASTTNSLYQSGDGLPGPELDGARTKENTQIHTVVPIFAEDMHSRDLGSKFSAHKNHKKGSRSYCVRWKIYQHHIN